MIKIHKNIISNNCTAAFIYHDLNCEFTHPFMWSTFTPYNFNKLLDEYDNINYLDIEIENTLLTKAYNTKRWDDTFSILIDNRKLCINFIHHHFKSSIEKIEKKGVDLYYRDMKKYVKELYTKRTNRMLSDGLKEPIFVFCKTIFYTKDEFYEIAYKPTKYKKIVCLPYDYTIDNSKIPSNTFIVKLPKDVHPEPKYADYLIKNYANLLEINNETIQ